MGASHGRHQLRLSLSRAPPAGRPVPTRPRTRPCRGRSAAHRSRRCRRRCTRVPVRCACRGPGREHEAAVELHGRGGRRVRDDRRMRPDRRAGDGRADGQRRRLRERTDHAPHEGALTLLVVPRMKVVGDPQRVEAGRLRTLGLVDKFLRTELLAGQEISDLGHGRGLPATGGLKHREGNRPNQPSAQEYSRPGGSRAPQQSRPAEDHSLWPPLSGNSAARRRLVALSLRGGHNADPFRAGAGPR
jgi:hypothetical protein